MKYALTTAFSLFICSLQSQKTTLSDLLWKEAIGQLVETDSDWAQSGDHLTEMSLEEESRITITDDSVNGYLRIYYEDEGCGCPFETIVAGYKAADGNYTSLKTYWSGCEYSMTLFSNQDLTSILPEDFDLHTFLPKSKENEYQITSSVFYLDAEIPQKGTDTQIDLTYIPFGIHMVPDDRILSYGYEEVWEQGVSNFLYSGALQNMLLKITDENTLVCILEKSMEDVIPEDRKIIEKLLGEGKNFQSIDVLASQIQKLKIIYEISKDIKYKSVILGWNRDEARFFVKEKIENDALEMSFLKFIRQLPFLLATC